MSTDQGANAITPSLAGNAFKVRVQYRAFNIRSDAPNATDPKNNLLIVSTIMKSGQKKHRLEINKINGKWLEIKNQKPPTRVERPLRATHAALPIIETTFGQQATSGPAALPSNVPQGYVEVGSTLNDPILGPTISPYLGGPTQPAHGAASSSSNTDLGAQAAPTFAPVPCTAILRYDDIEALWTCDFDEQTMTASNFELVEANYDREEDYMDLFHADPRSVLWDGPLLDANDRKYLGALARHNGEMMEILFKVQSSSASKPTVLTKRELPKLKLKDAPALEDEGEHGEYEKLLQA